MPIVGDFSAQSPLRGFYEEFFPDKTPSAGSDGGLSGKFPPETSPPRHTHYRPVSLERKVSGCLLVLSSAPWAPNARHQARREAGAQQTLYAVACMPLFGDATVPEFPESLMAHSSGFFALGQVHCMPTYLRSCMAARLYSYGGMP